MNKKFRHFVVFLMVFVLTFGICNNTVTVKGATNNNYSYRVLEGTKFYEKAENCGSGKSDVISKKNCPFLSKGAVTVYIDRYAVLDSNGKILKTDEYVEFDNLAEEFEELHIENALYWMYHISSSYELGWIDSNDIIRLKKEEHKGVSYKNVAEAIANRLKGTDKHTAFMINIVDYMPENEFEVLKILTNMDIKTKAQIVPFGWLPMHISYNNFNLDYLFMNSELRDFSNAIPYEANWYEAINTLTDSYEVTDIIALSDMETNGLFFHSDNEPLNSLIVYNPSEDYNEKLVKDLYDCYPDINLSIIKISGWY